MNRKLIILTTGLDYGGAETQLVRIATRLRQRRWEVRIVSMLAPKAFVADLAAAGIEVDSLEMTRGVPSPRAFLKLCGIVRAMRPYAVLSFMIHANIMARVARLFSPMPVLVCSARSITEQSSQGTTRWRDLAYRLTDRLCDLTVQNSEAGRRRYVAVRASREERITVIPNGLDLGRFQPSDEVRATMRARLGAGDACFVWLAVGRLEEEKDYPLMFAAFAQVAKVRDTRLVIAGKGSQRAVLEQLSQQLGIADKVDFLGVSDNVAGLMNAADALVLSSAWEGLPNVLIEAAAMELPCVATDVGGSAEVVQDGVTGIVVGERTAAALGGALARLMAMPAPALREMGRLSRLRAQRSYEIEDVVGRWEAALLHGRAA